MHNVTFGLGYRYFVHFSSRRLFAFDMEKYGITQCNEMTILTNLFVTLLCCSDSESKLWMHVLILNNEL